MACVDEQQKIAALDAGADDYVTKPFAVGELLARQAGQSSRSATAAAGWRTSRAAARGK